MNIADLLLLPDDEINYAALDVGVLLQLATQEDEPFIATSALGELGMRRVPEAVVAAAAILTKPLWDRYLHAFAITTLCATDPAQITEIMDSVIEQTNDPKVLGAMVECVLSEPDHFSKGAAQSFANKLAGKVRRVPPDEFTDLDERTRFLERFGAG
jgi:hypothetical protein